MNNAERSSRVGLEREEQKAWIAICNSFSRSVDRLTKKRILRVQQEKEHHKRSIQEAQRDFSQQRSEIIAYEVDLEESKVKELKRAEHEVNFNSHVQSKRDREFQLLMEKQQSEDRIAELVAEKDRKLQRLEAKLTKQLEEKIAREVAMASPDRGDGDKRTLHRSVTSLGFSTRHPSHASPNAKKPTGKLQSLTPEPKQNRSLSSQRHQQLTPLGTKTTTAEGRLSAWADEEEASYITGGIPSLTSPTRRAIGGGGGTSLLMSPVSSIRSPPSFTSSKLAAVGSGNDLRSKRGGTSVSPSRKTDSTSLDEFTMREAANRELRYVKRQTNATINQRKKAEERRAKEEAEEKLRQKREKAELLQQEKSTQKQKELAMNVERMLNPLRKKGAAMPMNVVADRGRSIGESLGTMQQHRRDELEQLIAFFGEKCDALKAEREALKESLAQPANFGDRSLIQRSQASLFSSDTVRRMNQHGGGSSPRARELIASALCQVSLPSPAMELMAQAVSDPTITKLDFSETPLELQDLYYLREVINSVDNISSINLSSHEFDCVESEIIKDTFINNMSLTKVEVLCTEFDPIELSEELVEIARKNREYTLHKRGLTIALQKEKELRGVEKHEASSLPAVRKAAHMAADYSAKFISNMEQMLRDFYNLHEVFHRQTIGALELESMEKLQQQLAVRSLWKQRCEAVQKEETKLRQTMEDLQRTAFGALKQYNLKEKRRLAQLARDEKKRKEHEREEFETLERHQRTEIKKMEVDARKELQIVHNFERDSIQAILDARRKAAEEEKERIRRAEAAKKAELERKRLEEERARRKYEAMLERHELERENLERAEAAQRERGVGAEERKSMASIIDEHRAIKAALKKWQAFCLRRKQRSKLANVPFTLQSQGIVRRTFALKSMVPVMLLDKSLTTFTPKCSYPSYMNDKAIEVESAEVTIEDWKRQKWCFLGASIIATTASSSSTDQVDILEHFNLFHSYDACRDTITDVHGQPVGHLVPTSSPNHLRIEVIRNDAYPNWEHLWELLRSVGYSRSSGEVSRKGKTVASPNVEVNLQVHIRTSVPTEIEGHCAVEPIADVRQQPWCEVQDASGASGSNSRRMSAADAETAGNSDNATADEALENMMMKEQKNPNDVPSAPTTPPPHVSRPRTPPTEDDIQEHFKPKFEYITTSWETSVKLAVMAPFMRLAADETTGTCAVENNIITSLEAAATSATSAPTSTGGGAADLETLMKSNQIDYNTGQGDAIIVPYLKQLVLPVGVTSCDGAFLEVDLGPSRDSSDYIWSGLRSTVAIHPTTKIVSLGAATNKIAEVVDDTALGVASTFSKRPRGAPTLVRMKLATTASIAMVQALITSLAFRNDSDTPNMEPRQAVISLQFPDIGCSSSIRIPIKFVKTDLPTSIEFPDEPVAFRLPPTLSPASDDIVEQPLCYISPDCVVTDPDTTDFVGGYLSIRVVDEKPTDHIAVIPRTLENCPTTLSALKPSPLAVHGGDLVYKDQRVGRLAQKTTSWIFIDFEQSSIDVVAEILQNVAYSCSEELTRITITQQKAIEVALVVEETPPVRAMCPLLVTPPLFTVGSSALKIVYRQGAGSQRLSHYDIIAEDAIEWQYAGNGKHHNQFSTAGYILIEVAAGFTDDDVLTLQEDDVLSIREGSDVSVVSAASSKVSNAASVRLGTSGRKMSMVSLGSTSRASPKGSSAGRGGSTIVEEPPASGLKLNGVEIGTVVYTARSMLIRFGNLPPPPPPPSDGKKKKTKDLAPTPSLSQSTLPPPPVVTRKEIAQIMKRLMFENVSNAPKDLNKIIRVTMNDGQHHSTIGAVEVDIATNETGTVLQRFSSEPKEFRSKAASDTDGFCLFNDVTLCDYMCHCFNGAFLAVELVGGGDANSDQLGILSADKQQIAFRKQSIRKSKSMFVQQPTQESAAEASSVFGTNVGKSGVFDLGEVVKSPGEESISPGDESPSQSDLEDLDGAASGNDAIRVVGRSLYRGHNFIGDIVLDAANNEGHSSLRVHFAPLSDKMREGLGQMPESAGEADQLLEANPESPFIPLSIVKKVLHAVTYTTIGSKVKSGARVYQARVGFENAPESIGKLRLTVNVTGPLLWNPDFGCDVTFKEGAKAPLALFPKIGMNMNEKDIIKEGFLEISASPAEDENGDVIAIDAKKCPPELTVKDATQLILAGGGKDPCCATVENAYQHTMRFNFNWHSKLTAKSLLGLLKSFTFDNIRCDASSPVRNHIRHVRCRLHLGDELTATVKVNVNFVTKANPLMLVLKKAQMLAIRCAPFVQLSDEMEIKDGSGGGNKEKSILNTSTSSSPLPKGTSLAVRVKSGCPTDHLGFILEGKEETKDVIRNNDDIVCAKIVRKSSYSLLINTAENGQCKAEDLQHIVRALHYKCTTNARDRHKRKTLLFDFIPGENAGVLQSTLMIDVLPPLVEVPPYLRDGYTVHSFPGDRLDIFTTVVVPNLHFTNGSGEIEVSLRQSSSSPSTLEEADEAEDTKFHFLEFGGKDKAAALSGGMHLKGQDIAIETKRVGKLLSESPRGSVLKLVINKERDKSVASLVQKAIRCITYNVATHTAGGFETEAAFVSAINAKFGSSDSAAAAAFHVNVKVTDSSKDANNGSAGGGLVFEDTVPLMLSVRPTPTLPSSN